jgi:hypothetical protein
MAGHAAPAGSWSQGLDRRDEASVPTVARCLLITRSMTGTTPLGTLENNPFVRMPLPIEPLRATVVFQNGRPVAEVFRDDGNPLVEHWVLFPEYVEPSHAPEIATAWIAGAKLYRGGTAEFFKRVPYGPGSRYLRIDCSTGKWLRG